MTGAIRRSVLAALLALGMAMQADAQVPGMSEEARSAWGFHRGALPPHPDVRFGILPNGMRYALMRNTLPARGLAVRMRIEVGATAEDEREQGFVHLLEHLIFEGSANLPKGAAAAMLQHQGLHRWSDFNAFTSYDETVYRLDLPRADARARETVLTLMREIATNLLFSHRIVRQAKQAVRQELAARDPVPDLILAEQNALFVPGTAIDRGPVTGTAASLRRASPAMLQRLYQRYYVPQRTTLVAVGDLDPTAMEAEIAAHFGDWKAGREKELPAALPPRSSSALPPWDGVERGPTIHLFVHRKAPTKVTFATVRTLAGADNAPLRDAQFLERLGSEMLARRLAQEGFAGAEASSMIHFGEARIAMLDVTAKSGDWRGAMIAGERALRQVRDQGFSQAELDAAIAATRKALELAAAPQTSAALADAVVDAASRGLVFTRPADPAAIHAYLARIRLEDVNDAMKAALWHGQRFIFVAHNRRIPDGARGISTEWTREFIPMSEEILLSG
jgi:zinc protease